MDKPEIIPGDLNVVLPLPLFSEKEVGTLRLSDGEELSVRIGLSEDLVQKLKEHAQDTEDTELQKNTSDYRRFVESSYEDWYKKDRTPFVLVSKTGELAAIIWFGPEKLPGEPEEGEWDTIAFRSYPPYRGKGIMTPFGTFALAAYSTMRPGRSIWLETGSDNEAGRHLYKKLGFTELGYQEHAGRVLMTRTESA